MSLILIESFYLPPITHIAKLLPYNTLQIEQHSHYQKASYRNRAYVSTSHGALMLSIPLKKGKNGHQPMREVRISYDYNWQKLHWYSLQTAYRSSPYFEYYESVFYPYYHRAYDYLVDFNTALLQEILTLLKQKKIISTSNSYISNYAPLLPDAIDIRQINDPKPNQTADINTALLLPEQQPYYQVFADKIGFIPNLSIIDLLFNTGNNAQNIMLL